MLSLSYVCGYCLLWAPHPDLRLSVLEPSLQRTWSRAAHFETAPLPVCTTSQASCRHGGGCLLQTWGRHLWLSRACFGCCLPHFFGLPCLHLPSMGFHGIRKTRAFAKARTPSCRPMAVGTETNSLTFWNCFLYVKSRKKTLIHTSLGLTVALGLQWQE